MSWKEVYAEKIVTPAETVRKVHSGDSVILTHACGESQCLTAALTAAAVTTSRNDVDYVVTEYGIAQLKGKSLQQRREALLAIAHPDFRKALAGA